jgi:co-chaperonin GroES (HSP10)
MSNEQVSITEIEKQVLEAFKEGDIVCIADLMKKDVQTDNDNQYVIYTDQFLLGSRSL